MKSTDVVSNKPNLGLLVTIVVVMTPLSETNQAQESALPETVVTATRIETPSEQVGSSVTVITGEELERRQVRVVSDVLRDVPGLAVSRTGVVGSLTQIRIRGAEANQSLVVIDGVRVNNPNGGSFDFNRLLNLEIERIEVLRGPSSVLWGSDAIGGVINIITKKAQRPRQASIAAEMGSFDTRQVTGSLGTRQAGYDLLVSGTYYETDGQSSGAKSRGNREDDGARIGTLNLKAGIRPSEQLEINLVGSYSDDNTEFDDFVGGTKKPVVDADNETDKTEYSLRVEGKLALLDGAWEHTLSAARYDIETDTQEDGATTFESEGKTNEAAYQTNYFFETPAFADGEHTITFLAEYKEDEYENVSSFGSFKQRSIDNYAYALHHNAGFYDKLFFTAGIRYDDNDRFDDTTTYRVTGAYLQRDWGTRFHGSYGKAVKNPTLFELFGFSSNFIPNPDLEPETGFGWDLGIEQSFLDNRVTGDITFFSSRIEDLIEFVFDEDTPTPTPTLTVANEDGESEARGVEVSAQATATDHLDIIASYTYTDTEDAAGDELVRRPEHVASLIFNYAFLGDRGRANLAIRYNGDQQDSASGSQVKLDAYTLVNLSGSYRFDEHFEIFGRVENLFDEDYEEVLGYGGLERAFYVGLKGAL